MTSLAEDGADILIGGANEDVLEGGAGSDTFVFTLGDGDGHDHRLCAGPGHH